MSSYTCIRLQQAKILQLRNLRPYTNRTAFLIRPSHFSTASTHLRIPYQSSSSCPRPLVWKVYSQELHRSSSFIVLRNLHQLSSQDQVYNISLAPIWLNIIRSPSTRTVVSCSHDQKPTCQASTWCISSHDLIFVRKRVCLRWDAILDGIISLHYDELEAHPWPSLRAPMGCMMFWGLRLDAWGLRLEAWGLRLEAWGLTLDAVVIWLPSAHKSEDSKCALLAILRSCIGRSVHTQTS